MADAATADVSVAGGSNVFVGVRVRGGGNVGSGRVVDVATAGALVGVGTAQAVSNSISANRSEAIRGMIEPFQSI